MKVELTEDEVRDAIAMWVSYRAPMVEDGQTAESTEFQSVSISFHPRPRHGNHKSEDWRTPREKFEIRGVVEYTTVWSAMPEARETDRRPRPARSGVVYFIGAETGPVKIGFTSGPVDLRLAALQTGSPVVLSVLGVVPGTDADERRIHRALVGARLHLEWFERGAALYALEVESAL